MVAAFDLFFVSALVIGALINTYTDIRGRWAPDYVNYGLIIIGVYGHLIQSAITKTYEPIFFSLVGAGAFYVLAALLFYTGQCGGGDAKFWIALGSLLPVYPKIFLNIFSPLLAPWPFLVSLTTNIFIAGAVIGVLFAVGSGLRNSKIFKKEISKSYNKNKYFAYVALVLVLFPLLMWYENPAYFKLSFAIWILVLALVGLQMSSKAFEKTAYKKIRPSKLEEGDWTVDKIRINGELVHTPNKIGIEKKEIHKLVKLEKQGKLKYIRVKDGFPFLVSFTLGILITITHGDLMLRILELII